MQRDGGPGPGGGPGGGGNPTGGSFTGAAEALEIIGNHAYAYSGLQAVTTVEADQLSFTSGNFYLVGKVQLNGPSREGSHTGGGTTCVVTLNGVGIIILRTRTADHESPSSVWSDIIIPPYTKVVCRVDSASVEAAENSVSITGRIYRG